MTIPQLSRSPDGSGLATVLLAAAGFAYAALLFVLGNQWGGLHLGVTLLTSAMVGGALGASIATMFERSWRLLPESFAQRASLLFTMSLPLAWAAFSYLPLARTDTNFGTGTLAQLFALCLCAALPGLLLGVGITVMILDTQRMAVRHSVQRAGMAIGCILVPSLLGHTGAGGLFLCTGALSLAAATAMAPMTAMGRTILLLLAAVAGFAMDEFDARLPLPGIREVLLASSTGPLEVQPLLRSQWSCDGRIEVVELEPEVLTPQPSPAGETSSPQTSRPIPSVSAQRWWIASHGRRGGLLIDRGVSADAAPAVAPSWRTLALSLVDGPHAHVCVLGLASADELWVARAGKASSIRVVEPSSVVASLYEDLLGHRSPLRGDARVELVRDDLRASLLRSDARYDLLVFNAPMAMPSDENAPVDPAVLQMQTVDAWRSILDHLTDNGIAQMAVQGSATDAMRLLHALHAAVPEDDGATMPSSTAVFHDEDDSMMVVLFQKGGFAPAMAVRLRELADAAGTFAVVMPDAGLRDEVAARRTALRELDDATKEIDRQIDLRTEGADDAEIARLRTERARLEAPRAAMEARCEIAEFVLAEDKAAYADARGLPARPLTDDSPFEKPKSVTPAMRARWLLPLAIASCLALLAVMLPLSWRGGAVGSSRQGAPRYLLTFACIGVAGVAVGMGLLQKMLPLLGSASASMAITLGTLLLSAALGSFLSHSFLNWEPRRGRYVALVLLLTTGVAAFGSPVIVELCAGLDLLGRILAVAVVVTPIGLCLGMTVPHGVRVLEGHNPDLVPWALCVAATGAAVSPLLAMTAAAEFGFATVLFAGGVAGAFAFLLLDAPAMQLAPQPEEGSLEANAEVAG